VDGQGTAAEFNFLFGIAIDQRGRILVTEEHALRSITPHGAVSTVAGSSASGSLDGPCSQATFCFPYGVAVDLEGRALVADSGKGSLRRVTRPDYAAELKWEEQNRVLFQEKQTEAARKRFEEEQQTAQKEKAGREHPDSTKQQWEQLSSEFKLGDCSLADFRALTGPELEQFVCELPLLQRGKFRNLHKAPVIGASVNPDYPVKQLDDDAAPPPY